MNKLWENPGKTMRISWECSGNTMNFGKIHGKTMGYLANGAFFVACRAYGSPFLWETMASTKGLVAVQV